MNATAPSPERPTLAPRSPEPAALPTLLVVDDEQLILNSLRQCFHGLPIRVQTAATAAEGLEAIARNRPDVVISDIGLPDLSGLELFQRVRRVDPKVPVIIITGAGTTETAIEAMKLGAYEYVLKPFRLAEIRQMVFRALEIGRLMRVPAVVPSAGPVEGPSDTIVGRSAAMQEVYKAIGRVAPQEVTVLVHGESGTGKELVARAIYQHSPRRDAMFLAVSCAGVPETPLESELFGHERGAFTGADRERVGKLEQCSGGILFLDEIGDLSPSTQIKLLRVLQEQQFERVGGNKIIRTNARLIAATNRNLDQLVAAGKFRQDLFYRLNVFPIQLPPLRERLEDLPLLVGFFVRRAARELHKEVQTIPAETISLLARYRWPGNLRELQSVLKQALVHATGPVLVPECFPAHLRTPTRVTPAAEPEPGMAPAGSPDDLLIQWSVRLQADSGDIYAKSLAAMERQLITQVLSQTRGNQLRAAAALGITRGSLRNKIRTLGIPVERPSGRQPARV